MNRQRLEALRLQGYTPRTMLDIGGRLGEFTQVFMQVFPGCQPTRIQRGVDSVRIDDLLAGRQFDVVAIDAPGSELEILAGGETVLARADYIQTAVSLVDASGGLPEDVFTRMAQIGFRCVDVTAFHRLPKIDGAALRGIDVLFERADRSQRRAPASSHGRPADVLALAERLFDEDRASEALVLFQHLLGGTHDYAAWVGVSRCHLAGGRVLEALRALVEAKALTPDIQALWPLIQQQTSLGSQAFNLHLNRGEVALAEPYASVMADLTPGGAQMIAAAMGCTQSLGRMDEALNLARRLIVLDPGHVGALTLLADEARAAGDHDGEIRYRSVLAVSPDPDIHPLVRLRDFHEAMSLLLCRPLSDADVGLLTKLAAEVPKVAIGDLLSDPEWAGWVEHYRALLGSLDIGSIIAPTPAPPIDPASRYLTATGEALDAAGLQALADRLAVKAVFFAAADENYVDQYGRWYALSVLRHCDVSSLVVIHVIGGAQRLAEAVKAVGVDDPRLVFVGDDFDASAVSTRCYDAPPKGLIALPVAHFQSVRFQQLGGLLDTLQRPIFVSDIDLLLQDRVGDLLETWAAADVVFNENWKNQAAGSRITANLLLVNPTPNAARLFNYLRAFLDDRLDREVVTRWIDQVALLLGRHHLMRHAPDAVLGCFDTMRDINNIMFESYQEHPFRFLSLYHGFDTSSLENDPRVLGEQPTG